MGVFEYSILVEFADTDTAGVVHFSNYFRYMERVEHAFWRSLGQSVLRTAIDGHLSFPRVRAECEYLKPARFEDTLNARLTIERIGDKSVQFRVEFIKEGELTARGAMVAVCCTFEPLGPMQPISIPEFVRGPLENFARRP